MIETDLNSLTEEERELYDRQIRLWGLESQKRIRIAKVLLIGVNGVGAEIAKNIVLAGIHSLTLMDTQIATEHDTYNQFLIPVDKIGQNRAEASVERTQALNPLVNVTSDTSDIFSKPDEFLLKYDIVIATGLSHSQMIKLNNRCREYGIKFFACNVNGLFGYSLIDLVHHEYAEEIVKLKAAPMVDGKRAKPEQIITNVKRTVKYPSIEDTIDVDFTQPENQALLAKLNQAYFLIKGLLKFREEKGRDPNPDKQADDLKCLRRICDEISSDSHYPKDKITDELLESIFIKVNPACAIVGGIIGQEIIKTISQVDPPIRNILYFDPIKSCVNVCTVGC